VLMGRLGVKGKRWEKELQPGGQHGEKVDREVDRLDARNRLGVGVKFKASPTLGV